MALSTDYVLRTGAFEPAEATINPQDVRGSCECSARAGGWGRTGRAQDFPCLCQGGAVWGMGRPLCFQGFLLPNCL